MQGSAQCARLPPHRESQEGDQEGPTGHNPATRGEGTWNPGPGGTRRRKQSWGAETLGPWVSASVRPRPRRATTYTKTPKRRARTPISMARSRMARPERLPRTRRLVLWAAPAARPARAGQTRGGEGGALQAAGGGGRRAPGGGGGGGAGSAQTSRLGPRVRGRRAGSPGAPGSASPRRAGGASGTPRSRASGAAPTPSARAVRPRPGRGSPGKPRAAAAPARSPAPGQCAAPGRRARGVSACGPCAAPRSADSLSLLSRPGTRTHVGM